VQLGRVPGKCRCYYFLLCTRQLNVPKSAADIDDSIGNLIKMPVTSNILRPHETIEIGEEKCGIWHVAQYQEPCNHIAVRSCQAFVEIRFMHGLVMEKQMIQ